jgi:hypothetical protein
MFTRMDREAGLKVMRLVMEAPGACVYVGIFKYEKVLIEMMVARELRTERYGQDEDIAAFICPSVPLCKAAYTIAPR